MCYSYDGVKFRYTLHYTVNLISHSEWLVIIRKWLDAFENASMPCWVRAEVEELH
jgi:hypothetical protein